MSRKSSHVEVNGEKLCTKCLTFKPLHEFVKDSLKPGGYRSNCKACLRAYTRARTAKRREKEPPPLTARPPVSRAEMVKVLNLFTQRVKIY